MTALSGLSKAKPIYPCPICGSQETGPCFSTKDYIYGISDKEFNIYQCRECRFGWVCPYPKEKELAQYYNAEFYESDIDARTLLARKEQKLKAQYQKISHLNPGLALEIGCMKGEFLYYLQQKGWKVEGIELDNHIPNLFHLPIRYGYFLEMDFKPQSYDLIAMWAVLEHLPNPRQYIHKCATLLKPQGTLLCLVTNFDSVPGYGLRRDDFPRHVSLFTPKAINVMLSESNQFLLERMDFDNTVFSVGMRGFLLFRYKKWRGYPEERLWSEYLKMNQWKRFSRHMHGKKSWWLTYFLDPADWLLSRLIDHWHNLRGQGFNITFKAQKR